MDNEREGEYNEVRENEWESKRMSMRMSKSESGSGCGEEHEGGEGNAAGE